MIMAQAERVLQASLKIYLDNLSVEIHEIDWRSNNSENRATYSTYQT